MRKGVYVKTDQKINLICRMAGNICRDSAHWSVADSVAAAEKIFKMVSESIEKEEIKKDE